ncbi:MAG TPA: M67 family metallopeptidase [Caldilineaceae bacterium]|nr:M67 family metallopeptidase [Caldilineaceae bacterium]
MNEAVRMPASAYAEIIAHAREGKPEEVCGLVRGSGLEVTRVQRAENVAENRIIYYDVDSRSLLEFALHEEEMVGVYHSHPESVGYPSATDAWIAEYPNKIYFICSLEDDERPLIRAYRMTAHFLDLDIAALSKVLNFYETRPNLFAYYQHSDDNLPPALATVAETVGLPFYLVYYRYAADEFESRVVQVAEHPIEVVNG